MPYFIGKDTKELKALDSGFSEPINLYKDISKVATGDVYQVLFMDMNGSLKSMDQQLDNTNKPESNKKFLVHVICQEVSVNDKPF